MKPLERASEALKGSFKGFEGYSRLKGGFKGLKGELKGRLKGLKGELKGEASRA